MFAPDLVVLDASRPEVLLVAEIVATIGDLDEKHAEVRRYMVDRRCELAFVVGPEETFLFRDPFTSLDGRNIEHMGPWPSPALFGAAPGDSIETRVARVQAWLERTSRSGYLGEPMPLDHQTRHLLFHYVVPILVDGRVQPAKAA